MIPLKVRELVKLNSIYGHIFYWIDKEVWFHITKGSWRVIHDINFNLMRSGVLKERRPAYKETDRRTKKLLYMDFSSRFEVRHPFVLKWGNACYAYRIHIAMRRHIEMMSGSCRLIDTEPAAYRLKPPCCSTITYSGWVARITFAYNRDSPGEVW